jgi:hypothetical protein
MNGAGQVSQDYWKEWVSGTAMGSIYYNSWGVWASDDIKSYDFKLGNHPCITWRVTAFSWLLRKWTCAIFDGSVEWKVVLLQLREVSMIVASWLGDRWFFWDVFCQLMCSLMNKIGKTELQRYHSLILKSVYSYSTWENMELIRMWAFIWGACCMAILRQSMLKFYVKPIHLSVNIYEVNR